MSNHTVNGKALGLAFWKKANEVAELARSGRGIVVMPTGTGKTTQTPQLLYGEGFTKHGMIYVSVPKRILAIELAARVADEMGVALGSLVGYQIRGESQMSRGTRIMFVTEGMLRAKIRSNPLLEDVSVILFDEFHQRTLMSDFNVALVERAQDEGAKAAFLLMSATIDPSYLAEHFSCGVVDGSDLVTNFPIEERYLSEDDDENFFKVISREAERLVREKRGNGLVFMPGKGEIAMSIEALQRVFPENSGVTILPLHGELGGDERHAPFTEREGITITVATDIVETGATLPNVGWVIDSGLAREKGYDPVSDISSLRVREIAQDRITQRRGRCGRVRSGVYVGLFSEGNFLKRPERTVPEIFRTPLREVVLTIKALRLSRENKPIRLVDYPGKANWQEAKIQLQMLGFVDDTLEARITELGLKAVELGCDPREAAMLFKAAERGCLREVAIAIATQQGKRLLYRPKGDEGYKADAAHQIFKTSSVCDAWTAVRVIRLAEERGEESLGEWCRKHYVSYRAIKDIWMVSRQLMLGMRGFGYMPNDEPGKEDDLRVAICAGLPDRMFEKRGRDWYCRGNYEAKKGFDSNAFGFQLIAWEVIEIQTRRGILPLITNAVVPLAE
jgi:HrpA-like RNA helicase